MLLLLLKNFKYSILGSILSSSCSLSFVNFLYYLCVYVCAFFGFHFNKKKKIYMKMPVYTERKLKELNDGKIMSVLNTIALSQRRA